MLRNRLFEYVSATKYVLCLLHSMHTVYVSLTTAGKQGQKKETE